MRARRGFVRWFAVAVSLGAAVPFLATAGGSTGAAAPPPLPPGCAPDRSAVAYHSDGSSAHPSRVPVTCAVSTGFGGRESQIKVAPDGDVVEEPAMTSPGLLGTGVIDNSPGPRPEEGNLNTSGLAVRSEEHTSELQSQSNIVCRLLL